MDGECACAGHFGPRKGPKTRNLAVGGGFLNGERVEMKTARRFGPTGGRGNGVAAGSALEVADLDDLAVRDDMQRGPVVPEGLADALGVEHDEAGVGLFLQLELRQVDALGGVDGDEVVERLHLGVGGHPQQVRGEEGHFEHVVPAVRIVGVGNVVLAEADEIAFLEEFLHAGVQRAGVRVAHDAHLGLAHERGDLLEVRRGIEAHRARMVREGAANAAFLERADGEHLQRLERGVAGVVHEHGDVLVVADGELHHLVDVGLLVLFGKLDPGDAADDVGAEVHGLLHQVHGAGLAHDAVLREGDDLDIHDALELVAGLEQGLEADQLGLGIHVGKGADVEVAVEGRELEGLADVGEDPLFVVVGLDAGGEFDSCHGAAHVGAVVGAQGEGVHHFQRIDLAEVQVGVDERLGDEVAGGINDLARLAADGLPGDLPDDALFDADVPEPGLAAELRVLDENVVHGGPFELIIKNEELRIGFIF